MDIKVVKKAHTKRILIEFKHFYLETWLGYQYLWAYDAKPKSVVVVFGQYNGENPQKIWWWLLEATKYRKEEKTPHNTEKVFEFTKNGFIT